MKVFDKWFLPEHETHLQEWMTIVNKRVDGRLTYQYHKYEAALKATKQRRLAIDVGAHVGLWSYWMARDFQDVAAFEPVENHRVCWHMNMKEKVNAEMWPYALGEKSGTVAMIEDEFSTGNTRIDLGAEGWIKMYALDDLNFPYLDFLKIDCEGYEMNVLRGAERTIRAHKPCIIVEQKGDMGKRYGAEELQAVRFLEGLGATVRGATSGDWILAWG